jgi:hypothetical protein
MKKYKNLTYLMSSAKHDVLNSILFVMKKIVITTIILLSQQNSASTLSTTSCPAKAVSITTKTHFGAGFFAEFGKVVDSLVHFDDHHIRSMYIDWTDQFFPYKESPHENGWDLYFEPIQISNLYADEPVITVVSEGYHKIHHQHCTDQWVLYDRYLPFRLHVHEKIQKYIRIKPTIQKKIDEFYDSHLKNSYCIGVHVRFAAAHAGEMPGQVTLNDYFREVDALLKKRTAKNIKIYLATDSNYVVNQFRQRYDHSKLVFLDAFRAHYNEDPHLVYENGPYWISHPQEFHAKKPGYKGGCDALMDCLLLSRCNVFVHSVSNVSTFTVFFNPYIKSVFIPHNVPLKPCGYQTHLIAPLHALHKTPQLLPNTNKFRSYQVINKINEFLSIRYTHNQVKNRSISLLNSEIKNQFKTIIRK